MTMRQTTSTTTLTILALALGAPLSGGCADGAGSAAESGGGEIAADVEVSAAALRVEQAERLLDRGEEIGKAKALLDEALGTSDITPEERSAALLALSRAHEALGETDAAIGVIEDEMAANAGNHDWAGRDFSRRLRKLLTGSESTPGPNVRSAEPVAPFAKVLLDYFPPSADGAVHAQLYLAGGDASVSDEFGTFNLRGALRAKQEQECPLCDLDVRVSQSAHQSDWLIIPRAQDKFADALTVFYFDLEKGRIPERYQAHLPMKVADIVSELEAGKSFVVAKERPGSPPALLLAAPRSVMLADVEDHLAQLDELPTEPVYIDISRKLRPEEIRGVVRGAWFGDLRSCYDELLTRNPQAIGKVTARFTIDREGKVSTSEIKTDDVTLQEQPFLSCLGEGLDDLVFPATDGTVTVAYPIRLTP